MPRCRILASAVALSILGAWRLSAQTPEVIRGHVVNDSGRVLAGATIIVTRGPDRLTQTTATDSAGNYSVRFEQGTGDYLVYVSSPGFKAARRRVQREQSERELVANFTLSADLALLAAQKVTAARPVRASSGANPTQLDPGSAEKWSDGVGGQIPPTIAGDLSAIAGTMSGVTMTANGPSILGSGSSSNLTTLNGMGLAAGAIPRAAHTETRVTGATYDATRGGFAGANIDVRLGSGSRNYQRQNGYVTFDPPALQFTDAASRSLGAASGGARGSFGADGELIRKALTYNVAIDLARSSSDPATLINADADALIRSGLSPDSVQQLIAAAAPAGLLSAPNVPSNRLHDGITWLGRLDDTRDTLQTRALTTYVGYTSDGALGFSALSAPSAAGERHERTLGTQLTFGDYVGPGRRTLTETRFAASSVNTQVSPYRKIPGASVLVRSTEGSAARDLTAVSLGGSPIGSDNDRWTLEGSNETTWNAIGRRHRFRTSVWGRADGLNQQGTGNELGTFSFNSVADFAANKPSSFTRTLAQPARTGATWNTAAAFSHWYAPSRFFNLLYGARVEVNGFGSHPSANPALEQALGVTTGAAPTLFHVSPRIGFTYQYNRDRDNGQGTNQTNVGRFYRYVTGTLRGGIGDFRDLLYPNVLADASAATGLADGTLTLSCVGSATPIPDWSQYSNPSTIPTACLNGSSALAERAPTVTLIDPRYDVPHSWRASLEWTTSLHNWLLRINGLGSYDLSQPGIIDPNFDGIQKQTLASEGNRPVFVSAAAIDAGTGSVSAAESRTSPSFGRVSDRVSDLRGYGGQLTFGLSPDVFKFRSSVQLFASANYTLQDTRRQFRGFDGAGFGDPRVREWAAGPNDARHVLVLSGGFNTAATGTVTMFARAQSGLPFTPLVQGDINGDGRSGDRAFVPDPANPATDPAVASQLRTLLTTGSSTARSCLESSLGKVAVRNGCRGPWTESFNVQWRPPVPGRLARRVTPNVYLQNVLAGLDRALHGGSPRGWGSSAFPDPVLLVPRSFNSATPAFSYDVNSRFADTRPQNTFVTDPFRIVVDFSVDLSVDYDLQQLRRAVEPVKGASGGWELRNADSLASFYLSNTSSIHKVLLEQSDSLFLSKSQIAQLMRADSAYSAQVREIYTELGRYLAEGRGGASQAALDSVQATQKAYWKIFWRQPEVADSIVTPSQRELIPIFKSMLATPQKDREHSQWQFGHPVLFIDKKSSGR